MGHNRSSRPFHGAGPGIAWMLFVVTPQLWLGHGLSVFAATPPVVRRSVDDDSIITKLRPPGQRGAKPVGGEQCLSCHSSHGQEPRGSLVFLCQNSRSRVFVRRGCEGCHGPGSRHGTATDRAILNPCRLDRNETARLCLSCHVMKRKIQDPDFHFPGHSVSHTGCLDCHRVHHAKGQRSLKEEPNRLCASCHVEVKAQFLLRSRHPVRQEGESSLFSNREGKMACVDCHHLASPTGDPLGRDSVKESCVRCHPETQGPFLFAHDAGSAEVSQGCLTCHAPHGSANRHLLKASGRALCVSCHSDQSIGHYPGPSCSSVGCHQDIHGSNRNQYFLR